MIAENESKGASGLVHAAIVAVALLLFYALSSGPAQYLDWSKSRGFYWAKSESSTPYPQGSFGYSRWISPLRKVYVPLEWLSRMTPTGRPLVWYWGLFGARWHAMREIWDSARFLDKDAFATPDRTHGGVI
jgi:hypothetical protein